MTIFRLLPRLSMIITGLVAISAPQATLPLRNPGFEAGLEAWSTHVYGAQPEIAVDTAVAHAGQRSLRVSSAAPSDTAFGQEIRLTPSKLYRFSGWVRTRGLNPGSGSVYGTFQIQQPAGRGVIASGGNHAGNMDWSEVPIYFRAPAGGLTRIAIFSVGYGRGTGTAWFDDLRVDEVNETDAPIKITPEPLCAGSISPLQYGQFVEYLCDLVPSMWAEKLYDGSFEGLSPYKFHYLKETDFKEHPWHPAGATNRAEYSLDRATHVSGDVSQKIAADEGAPATVGIAQDGIAVQKGVDCRFSIWMKQEGLLDSVTVRLHREGKEIASCRFMPTGEWRRYGSGLGITSTATDATLTIEFRGPGTLWLDNASLMPDDQVRGWRRDVVEAVRALKPGVIRFGGSTLDDPNLGDFHWRDTIGDPDHRRPFRAWGGLQPTGPGLEEIVNFCRIVGAEPLICVRFTGSTPEEAAAQVQYFNGAADTPMGALRVKNGHSEPWRIRYWQVGNEMYGPAYEAGLPAFCRAMKGADPSIKLCSSYPTPAVLRGAGQYLDFVSPHHYGCTDLAGKAADLANIARMVREFAPGRKIKVAVTEWNTTAGDEGPRRAMLWTLANALACARYHNLMHRHADQVEIANRSNLINSFCSGIIQTDRHRLYKTPTYYAQQLYATLAGTKPLRIVSELPADLAPDVSATLAADGRTVTLFAVNDSPSPITRALDLSAFHAEGAAEVLTLADRDHAGEPDVTNSFDDPERIHPRQTDGAAGQSYSFPPYSLSVLRWKISR